MPTFRAYTINKAGKITSGDWLEAENIEEARNKAHELCDDGHPVVELWHGPRKLDEVLCENADKG
jgi:hypothetical protein